MLHFPFSSLLTFPFIFSLFLFAASLLTTKALFNQFNGAHSEDKIKDLRDSDFDSDSPFAPSHQREKSPQLPPLRECSPPPPPLEQPPGFNGDRPLPEDVSTLSTVVRSQSSHPKDRGSMYAAAFDYRLNVGSSQNSTQTVEATSTRSVTSPNSAKPAYGGLRPATLFFQKSIGSTLPATSWSEGVEGDLEANLGSHERTRQEALWEIAANEERYGFYPCSL